MMNQKKAARPRQMRQEREVGIRGWNAKILKSELSVISAEVPDKFGKGLAELSETLKERTTNKNP